MLVNKGEKMNNLYFTEIRKNETDFFNEQINWCTAKKKEFTSISILIGFITFLFSIINKNKDVLFLTFIIIFISILGGIAISSTLFFSNQLYKLKHNNKHEHAFETTNLLILGLKVFVPIMVAFEICAEIFNLFKQSKIPLNFALILILIIFLILLSYAGYYAFGIYYELHFSKVYNHYFPII
jgi:hypothetical protein